MSFIQSLFLDIFVLFYMVLHPVFKNPVFATYVAILILFVVFTYLTFRWFQRQQRVRTKAWKYWGMVVLQVYLIGFLFWYVFVYFHTYRTLK